MLRVLRISGVFPKNSAGTCVVITRANTGNQLLAIPEYNIVYNRPKPVKFCDTIRTGDLGLEHGVKGTDFLAFYGQSTELDGANDYVKRAFTLDFHPRKETMKARTERIIARVKRHCLDRGSPEVKIAAITSEIHQLLEIYEIQSRNKVMKSFLKHMIDKRAVLLKHLRTLDYKRFEWLLERLNLVYKPYPTAPAVIGRKGALRVLTDQYCQEVVTQKLNSYKESLNRQKPEFYEQMAEMLKQMMSQEEKYGLHKSVTQEDVDRALENARIARRELGLTA